MHQSVKHLQTLLYMTGCLRLVLAVTTFLLIPEMLEMTTVAQMTTLTEEMIHKIAAQVLAKVWLTAEI